MPERIHKPGTSALHLCMVGLVLLNLVFVYLTEVTSSTSLLPLVVLTIASPLLARFKENKLYRALWNIGVVGVFGLLVSHAMDRDMAYVLEDGLILAVLCQVHLLNNLHEQQRPDLLFLNSYLIALITGYITVDMGFAGAFLIYAPFYVIGLQFLSASRPGKTMAAADSRAVFFDGVKRSGVLVGVAILAFMFWPRDFEREALLAKYMDFDPPSGRAEVAFSETLELKKQAGTSLQQEVVLTAQVIEGDASDVPSLWRGATLRLGGRGSWERAKNMRGAADPLWVGQGLTMERDAGEARVVAELRVARKASGTKRLFMPRQSSRVLLDSAHKRGRLELQSDGTSAYSNPGELRYAVSITDREPGDVLPLGRRARGALVQYQKSLSTQSCIGLAQALLKRMGGSPSAEEIAVEFSEHLAKRYTYRLPGDTDAAGTLHDFLTTDGGGHCEFFASALGIMLRVADVPARVVTGYRTGPWEGTVLEVTNLDAHAWVEAYIEGKGWVTLDPTPAGERNAGGPGLFARMGAAAQGMWNRVTGFDGAARAAAMAWIKAAPGRAYHAVLERTWVSLGVLGAIVCAFFMVRQLRRRRVPLSVRRLESALKKAGVRRLPGETPREILERVQAALPAEGPPQAGPALDLEVAIAAHEQDRYART